MDHRFFSQENNKPCCKRICFIVICLKFCLHSLSSEYLFEYYSIHLSFYWFISLSNILLYPSFLPHIHVVITNKLTTFIDTWCLTIYKRYNYTWCFTFYTRCDYTWWAYAYSVLPWHQSARCLQNLSADTGIITHH